MKLLGPGLLALGLFDLLLFVAHLVSLQGKAALFGAGDCAWPARPRRHASRDVAVGPRFVENLYLMGGA